MYLFLCIKNISTTLHIIRRWMYAHLSKQLNYSFKDVFVSFHLHGGSYGSLEQA